ncbi:hypothetical protein INQ16_32465, partial [Escherichia coli]|nr:hypothetical protein [Escherichia coli]
TIDFIYGVINWKELVDAETQAKLEAEVEESRRTAPRSLAAAPVWATLYWPVVVLVWARILLSLIGFLRPAWKPLRAALILGSTAGTLAIAAALRATGQIV